MPIRVRYNEDVTSIEDGIRHICEIGPGGRTCMFAFAFNGIHAGWYFSYFKSYNTQYAFGVVKNFNETTLTSWDIVEYEYTARVMA